jgi:SAM-dependent methyltransferase
VSAIEPMPSLALLKSHYEHYYLTRKADVQAIERLACWHDPVIAWLLDRMRPRTPLRVLDYGFGSGSFLVRMSELGHRAYGADLSAQNVEQLRSYCDARGLSIALADPDRHPLSDSFEGQGFDLITLFQVVEHVTQPLQLLQRLAPRQPAGAYLYVECPNHDAVLAWLKRFTRVTRERRKIWGSLKYPEHLHGFNRRALGRMLEIAGYDVVECADYGYRDGVRQVEAQCWWPRFRDNPRLGSLFGLSRSAIPLADRLMSACFHAGSGLYALGRRRADGVTPA